MARSGGLRGADLPWRRSVGTLAAGLLAAERLPTCESDAVDMAERLLSPALHERQAARLGIVPVGVGSKTAPPSDDDLAKRIARAHNAMRAAFGQGGVLAFSEEGRALWPLADGDDYALPIERLPFPVHDQDVTVAEVKAWLAAHREWQQEAFELRDAEREERAARGDMRRGEDERNYGMVRGAANCEQCGAFKSKPSAPCGQCGDVPVSHHGSERDYDVAHGRAA